MKSLVEVIIISLLLQFGCAEESIFDRLNISGNTYWPSPLGLEMVCPVEKMVCPRSRSERSTEMVCPWSVPVKDRSTVSNNF